MATEQKGFDLREFIARQGVIPLDDVCGESFDLMKAATLRPKPGKRVAGSLVPMHGGFTEDFFNQLKLPDGVTELNELLSHARSIPVDDLVGLYESTHSHAGYVEGKFVGQLKASGKGGTSSVEDCKYSLTDMKIRSLTTSVKLMPFLAQYINLFASSVPLLSSHFCAKPTVFRGNIDKVVAFIVTTLTGKAQRDKESSKEISGERKVAGGLPPATGEASEGFSQSASQKDERKERAGVKVLGAAVCLVHLQKTVRSPQVHVKDHTIVQQEDDPLFISFLRRVRLKEFRSLIVGRRNATLGFFTQRESIMQHYATLDYYVAAQLEDAGPLSLRGWDDGRGIVRFEVDDGDDISQGGSNTLELSEQQRVKGGKNRWKKWFSSCNYLYSASREELSALYLTLKKEGSVEVDGVIVVAMSPAFTVETGNFLPIYHRGRTNQGDVPASVVRDFGNSTFIFPVEGHEHNKHCVTVYDEQWYVQESIVQVDRSDTTGIHFYEERGFHAIQDPDGDGDASKIAMGRHRLVLEGEEDIEAEEPVIGTSLKSATGDATEVPSAASIPSLQSASGVAPPKKQKTK